MIVVPDSDADSIPSTKPTWTASTASAADNPPVKMLLGSPSSFGVNNAVSGHIYHEFPCDAPEGISILHEGDSFGEGVEITGQRAGIG